MRIASAALSALGLAVAFVKTLGTRRTRYSLLGCIALVLTLVACAAPVIPPTPSATPASALTPLPSASPLKSASPTPVPFPPLPQATCDGAPPSTGNAITFCVIATSAAMEVLPAVHGVIVAIEFHSGGYCPSGADCMGRPLSTHGFVIYRIAPPGHDLWVTVVHGDLIEATFQGDFPPSWDG